MAMIWEWKNKAKWDVNISRARNNNNDGQTAVHYLLSSIQTKSKVNEIFFFQK